MLLLTRFAHSAAINKDYAMNCETKNVLNCPEALLTPSAFFLLSSFLFLRSLSTFRLVFVLCWFFLCAR